MRVFPREHGISAMVSVLAWFLRTTGQWPTVSETNAHGSRQGLCFGRTLTSRC